MISHRVIARRPDLGQGATVRLFLVVGVVLALFVGMGTRAPQALAAKKESANSHTDARELQAREAFASSRYREALDLYAKLYAEKLHPTYLRNIGRCHQNMGEAEEAIISFRDYLRKAPDLTSGEREEVDGFIKEMETLRDKQRQQRMISKPLLRRPCQHQLARLAVTDRTICAPSGSSGGRRSHRSSGRRPIKDTHA
jgi:tetratricopeptide (TPR) repeat protein